MEATARSCLHVLPQLVSHGAMHTELQSNFAAIILGQEQIIMLQGLRFWQERAQPCEASRCSHVRCLSLTSFRGVCRVEYFGVKLEGFAFTENGWVQSYGSRYVRPPIIYGDVSRTGPITVKEFKYAQSLTQKPVKGMLTGETCTNSSCACCHSFDMCKCLLPASIARKLNMAGQNMLTTAVMKPLCLWLPTPLDQAQRPWQTNPIPASLRTCCHLNT